jgi:allophanate hydrolase subunit 2
MFATVSYKVNKRTYPVVAFNSTGIVGGYRAMTTVETNYTDSFAGQTPGDELNFGWTSSAEL